MDFKIMEIPISNVIAAIIALFGLLVIFVKFFMSESKKKDVSISQLIENMNKIEAGKRDMFDEYNKQLLKVVTESTKQLSLCRAHIERNNDLMVAIITRPCLSELEGEK